MTASARAAAKRCTSTRCRKPVFSYRPTTKLSFKKGANEMSGMNCKLEADVGLLPCPFCGGRADMNHGGFGECFVTCADDNCGGRLGTGIWFTTAAQAMDVWNRRPNDPAHRTQGGTTMSGIEVATGQLTKDLPKGTSPLRSECSDLLSRIKDDIQAELNDVVMIACKASDEGMRKIAFAQIEAYEKVLKHITFTER